MKLSRSTEFPAAWIVADARERLIDAGALVFDPISILGSHLAETARNCAGELFGRQELQTLLEHLKTRAPALVKEIGGEALPLGVVHRAFLLLLREQAWPRDPIAVLEAMIEAGTRDAAELAEAARRSIVPSLLRRRNLTALEPLLLDPALERALLQAWSSVDALDPSQALALRERVESYAGRVPRERAAVVCTAALRPVLADLLLRSGLRLNVFAYGELPAELTLQPADVIRALQGS